MVVERGCKHDTEQNDAKFRSSPTTQSSRRCYIAMKRFNHALCSRGGND